MKKCSANIFLESVPLLYLLFFAMLVHLGYFMFLKDVQSILIFCMVSIFVYLINPNMILVLAISLLFVDALYLINANSKKITEGFTRTVTFKDPSGVDISANEFIEKAMKHITPKPTKSIKEDVSDDETSDDETSDETTGNNLKEVDEQSKKMKNVIEKVKSVSPEVVDSLSMLNGIDISELNKLINNMNSIAKTLTK